MRSIDAIKPPLGPRLYFSMIPCKETKSRTSISGPYGRCKTPGSKLTVPTLSLASRSHRAKL